MTAKIAYRIEKTTLLSDPDSGWRWVLIRGGSVSSDLDSTASGVLPDVDAAVFTSETEANLFSAHLIELEKRAGDRR